MLSKTDRDRVGAAISAAELHTSGEIQVVVARASDGYMDVALGWSAFAALVTAIALATVPVESLDSSLAALQGWGTGSGDHRLAIVLASALAFLLVWLVLALTPLRHWAVPAAIGARRVRMRAIEYFRVATEWRTAGRTGVLILLSIAEHRAEIVADAAIHAKVQPESWGDAMRKLIEAVRDDHPGDGLCLAIAEVGTLLAAHFPPGTHNPNEVPDRLIEI